MEAWATSADVFGYGVVFFVIGFLIGEYKERNRRWKWMDESTDAARKGEE